MDRIQQNFCIHVITDKISIGIVTHTFRKFATKVRPILYVQKLFLLNILRMNGQNLTIVLAGVMIAAI